MKQNYILISSVALAFLATGCVKPAQEPQTVNNSQPVYEEGSQIVYGEPTTVSSSGVIYSDIPVDNTVVTTGPFGQPIGQPVGDTVPYTNPYGNEVTSYPDPYGGQPTTTTSYPATSYPATSAPQGSGGIHLQIAALKDYYAAEAFKNSLSLDPRYSAYVQRGSVNKVIVTGIASVAEANRLKERRFPGAFIVHQGSVMTQPAYDYGYTDNSPYGSSPSMGSSSGVGVQIGAFSTQAKAQSIANSNMGQYPAIVKKIGRYYKVILTGFSSRSDAKSALTSGRIPNGFVVNY